MTQAKVEAGRTRQAVKKGAETSTLLALAPSLALAIAAATGDAIDVSASAQELATGHWQHALLALVPVALSRVPWALRHFGWERTAGAFEDARAEDSPGGEDVTFGELVDIGEAAREDWGALEDRDEQRGEGDE